MLEQKLVSVEQGPANVFEPAQAIVAGGNVPDGGGEAPARWGHSQRARYSWRIISSFVWPAAAARIRLCGSLTLLCTTGPLTICSSWAKFESTGRSHWQAVSPRPGGRTSA